MRNGADGVIVTDGPYAETVEQLTGFYVVDTDDLDDLLQVVGILAGAERRDRGPRHRGPLVGQRATWRDRSPRGRPARRVGPAAGPARRAVPPPRPRRGRPGDAFEAAARTWPRDGVPDNPPAWLLTAARRRILDRLRAEAVAARKLPLLAVEAELHRGGAAHDGRRRRGGAWTSGCGWCCSARTPRCPASGAAALTLRLVLGVPTEDIARLFLVSTPTMAARLTRARKRLAGETFAVPAGAELAARVGVVADVAYLAFTAGYAPGSGRRRAARRTWPREAIRLVRVLREVLPAGVAGAPSSTRCSR